MIVTKTSRKTKLIEINTVSELEAYFVAQDKNFVCLPSEKLHDAHVLLSHTSIGVKKLRSWYRKTICHSHVSQKSIGFWTCRGHSIEDAKKHVFKRQSSSAAKRFNSIKEKRQNGDTTWKAQFNMNAEYYEARGYNQFEAKKMAHERQITFSLQKCIAKHGLEIGKQIWEKRQVKWVQTLNSKSDEEKLDIMRRRVVPLGRASKKSLSIIIPIHKMLIDAGVCVDDDVYYGYGERKEWFMGDSSQFFLYDFCVRSLKLIIEYQGSVWHPPKEMIALEELLTWKTRSGVDGLTVRQNDERKRELAERRGFTVVYLYENDDVNVSMQRAFEACKEAAERVEITVPIQNVKRIMQTSNVSVSSPYGFVNVTEFHEKQRDQFTLLLTDGRRLTCSGDHYIRLSNGEWTCVQNLEAAKDITYTTLQIRTDNGNRGVIAIVRTNSGTVVDLSVDHPEHAYYTNGIESHNTGKSLLALAASLQQLKGLGSGNTLYEKLIIMRPVQAVGRDIGFLPGSLEEKMAPWIAPIKDNLNFLFNIKNTKKPQQKKKGNEEIVDDPYVQLMVQEGKIEIEAITFIRGRSIPNSIILVDEAQNLSLHELKTILTRASEGTKVLLTGDINQIDNSALDAQTNAMTYAIERFKNSAIAGHVTLRKGERSELATLASEIL